jgi:AcrR family transcriptional regulator
MARPPSITDDEILAAARAVFLRSGIIATVEDVAERCGVGVATIFRRFPTKQALFTAAMDVAAENEWTRYLTERMARGADRGDARAALTDLAHTMLEAARKMMPLIMMRMSNPTIADRDRAMSRALTIIRSLTEYFTAEIDQGRMIDVDPRVAARIWLGAIRHAVMFEALGPPVDQLSTEDFISGLVDMFCKSPGRRRRP